MSDHKAAPREREPFVYRCRKHDFTLESRTPQIGGALKVFCPKCKDEFWAQHIPELTNENPNAGKLKAATSGAKAETGGGE